MASSFLFEINSSSLAPALWFESYFRTAFLRKIRKVTQWLLVLVLGAFLLTFLGEQEVVSPRTREILLGLTLVLFGYGATIFLLEQFGESLKRVSPNKVKKLNGAEFLSFEVLHASQSALRYAKQRHFFAMNSALLLLFLLKEIPSLRFLFGRMLLDGSELEKAMKEKIDSEAFHAPTGEKVSFALDFQQTINRAIDTTRLEGRERAEIEDVLAALAFEDAFFKQYLIERDFTPELDIPNVVQWYYRARLRVEEQKKFWLKKNLRRFEPFGREWAAGYTITLDAFSYDISKEVRARRFLRAIGHREEKEAIERILSREQTNNVLLVGNPGSGRKRLVEDLASKSQLGECQNTLLNYQRVVELDLVRLVASIESLEEAEAILNEIFHEVVTAGNIILVIDDLHNFVGSIEERAAGRVNIAGILSSYLRSPQFPFVALTTFAGLHRYVEQNPSFLSFFEQVRVRELSIAETLEVLQEAVPGYETRHKKLISYPALQAIVAYADKYIQAVPFPQKALELLDDAMAYLAQGTDRVLLASHIAWVTTERTQIPVGEIEAGEREALLDLERLLHERIVNQEEAVREVASALRRARAEVATRQGPMGSFLFLGPTGVGKTETAKALAAIYFGSEKRMIRLDMSEFQKVEDIERLLASTGQEGLLTHAVRQNPFSLVLLDELEKAHANILNLFLQVLDEGYITDGIGRRTDFRHTMIIATSNAAYELILQAIKEKKEFSALKKDLLDFLFEKGIFRPEFINRFDGVILFRSLTPHHLLKIAGLMLAQLQQVMKEKGIEFEISEELKGRIAELGYDPIFGARNMRRVLQDRVENSLAIALLSRTIKRGDRITVNPETFEVEKLETKP